jgi:hypothetical protein
MFEYHIMGARTMQGIQEEMAKRAKDGWEPIIAYQEVEAGKRHVMIFRRAKAA